jgi:hypothetical protein
MLTLSHCERGKREEGRGLGCLGALQISILSVVCCVFIAYYVPRGKEREREGGSHELIPHLSEIRDQT